MKKLIFLLLFSIIGVNAQDSSKYSNEFLNIGVDAQSIGMSNAVVSSTSDVNSTYWNPAGLLQLKDKQISLMHSNYFANIATYNFVAYATPIDDESALGFSMIRFGVDDILDTTQLIDDQGNINFDRINLFSTADYAFLFSYARKLKFKNLNYGVNIKIIRRIIGDFSSSWGFGMDFGIQFKTSNNWNFGLMARDITTTYNSWSINEDRLGDIQNAIEGQNQEIPSGTEITIPKLQLGASKEIDIKNSYTLLAALDLILKFEENNDIISTNFASINPALGLEFGYLDLVFLRLGIGNFQNELQFDNSKELSFQPNFGIGFKYKSIEMDYAFTDIGNQSIALYSNIFSLKFDFNLFR
ncbi:MAG: PorV/PorQ family protein [Flavobacteriaceae bacterium]|jgi:hypothetical protein|nr:PorV/PorQ family protein [Flavobacteriaceae bacterium]MBT4112378.1 PorV/PorQ family protein [Flavobacteriaceae bacterium]MBT4614232.1 PorV/PorQ family protein [Flavobacteriaceae bacterium]MBT5246685.1 PorV/PorQ family protein [Flavobacteriaceae bacterium]MBT5649870.1 PorV/PorQ family protein [Flavobacteriaceae bacterium]